MNLFLSLVPILITLGLVIKTKKVVVSLLTGIFVGSILITFISEDYSSPLVYLVDTFTGIITDYEWYMPLLIFIIVIGIVTALISVSGGTRAFADKVTKNINNKYLAQLVAWVFGILIFVDDYLNALVIGEISKPITDKHKVSRAKLAYIIDSTAAPVVVLIAFSTWGAYIIGLMGDEFANNGLSLVPTAQFLELFKFQFYPIIALVMVVLTIMFDIKLFKMNYYEDKAEQGQDESMIKNVVETDDIMKEGRMRNLIIPFVTLIGVILISWYAYSINAIYQENKAIADLIIEGLKNMQNTDINLPLVLGAISSFVVTVYLIKRSKDPMNNEEITEVVKKSGLSLVKSVGVILILAWLLADIMGQLNTGENIANFIKDAGIDAIFLPLILFSVAGIIAFSTGTSWTTFSILIPIAVPIAVSIDLDLVPILIASVLGGGVFGDHCSPISDTTVLSSTGAKCKLDVHFITQLPYALIAGLITIIAYLVLGLTESLALSYVSILTCLFIFVIINKYKKTNK